MKAFPEIKMDNFYIQSFLSLLTTGNIREISTTTATSFALIAAAEIGDKSQLVCMTLALGVGPYRLCLVLIAAFAFLNTLAVIFGVAIASWLPNYIVAATVSFIVCRFDIHSLMSCRI
jgi:putative Ca2+/H+ antiporter (TMEM165/GDT1 family)